METATEPMETEHKHAIIDANSGDAKAKRKSVSFVDEKLIMDALNSTTISNGTSGGMQSKPHFARSNSDKPNGSPGNKSQHNGRGGGAPSSNGKRYPNGATNGHSKGNFQKSEATNGAAKNNPVIVYYNNPAATEINVDQLLTKPVAAAESPKLEGNHSNNNNFVPKTFARQESNGHTNNHQNGHNKYMTNGTKTANGNSHPSKFADNWRQSKGLRMDHPQYSKVKTINGHSYNGEGPENGTGGSGKPNGKAYNNKTQPKVANGKTNGTFEKKVTPKSEPITIYYSTPESSEVIEQNLKQLQIKSNHVAQTNNNGNNSEKQQSINGQVNGGSNDESASVATNAATGNGATTESSQKNVMNENTNQQTADIKMEMDNTTAPLPTPPVVSGDHYDVISGGVPIEAPVLPTEGERHALRCMLVSHPGHFYVKFVNPQHETMLTNMNQFYNSDEHIDLSVDVLKAGQYFAANRPKLADPTNKEWIRVQLLHVESSELINCLLIDEGCFGVFSIATLQPLYNQFRSVPKQAIRASLSGVIPKEIDWLPKQALDFKNLVADRQFHTGQQQFDQKTFDEKQTLEIELYFTEQDGELANKSVADIVVERDIASKK